jgi:prepilin-type N-terminal cleavage/methylation domain-containing protein
MKRRGFTLLELLVAMLMVGIVGLSLFAMLQTSFHARAAADRAVEPSRTASLALDYMVRDIQGAVNPGGKLSNMFLGLTTTAVDASGNAVASTPAATAGGAAAATAIPYVSVMAGTVTGAFEGTDQSDDRGNPGDDLKFLTTAYTPTHPEGGNGDMKWVELTVVTSQNGQDHLLVRKSYSNLLPMTVEDPDTEVICRGVYGFNLRYYDPVNQVWQDSWDCSLYNNQLPAAIEITLQLERPLLDGGTRIISFTRVVQMPVAVASTMVPTVTVTPTDSGQ